MPENETEEKEEILLTTAAETKSQRLKPILLQESDNGMRLVL
ncbi:MAG: hypothetical protein WB988_16010 [Candidatus Nitrosopolaris sp.]